MKNLTPKTEAIINLSAIVVVIAINYAIAIGWLGAMTQKAVSALYQTAITPAGFTFAIWGVIYAALLASAVYFLSNFKNKAIADEIKQHSLYLRIMLGLNILWNLTFSYQWIGLSVLIILAYWACLLKLCFLSLRGSHRILSFAHGLHAGWIAVASVVNIAAWLVQIKWSGFGIDPMVGYYLGLIIVMLVGASLSLRLKPCGAMPLAIVWAMIGIYSSASSSSSSGLIPTFSIVGIVLFLLIAGWNISHNFKKA
jgi:hypothetical protein